MDSEETSLPVEEMPLFAYGGLTSPSIQARVLGRRLEGNQAVLAGYRVDRRRGYVFLIEDDSSQVEGVLFRDIRPSDYWVLDDYQGLEYSQYERRAVRVREGDREVSAYTYVAGAGMAGTESMLSDKHAEQEPK
ncbi:MAG: gamma-glutamylcyclotransferase [Armatimonadetes bacterium]|nr:gamma-glutamylcyclotransferase [Armatimonadota bacterium]